MSAVIHRGEVAPERGLIDVLFMCAGGENQSRSDPTPIRRVPLELDLQIVMGVVSGLDVMIYEGRRVDIVHHEVEFALDILVGPCRAVREARAIYPPFLGLVSERQVSGVPEDIVRFLVTREPIEEL